MSMNYSRAVLCCALLLGVACGEQQTQQTQQTPVTLIEVANEPAAAGDGTRAEAEVAVPAEVSALLSRYCVECHGETKQKGKVRFDTLGTLDAELRAELMDKAYEALEFEEMPPKDAAQPGAVDRQKLLDWLHGVTDGSGAEAVADKMRYPHYGNLVNHEQLFSGEDHGPAYTPARRWLVSPQIFHERVMDLFQLESRERENYATRSFYGVTNPFILTDHSGVRYYDLDALDGGHLLIMLNNAQWIASKQIQAARIKRGDPAAKPELNPKDKWYPRTTHEAFETVILKDTPPTDDELTTAIHTQFQLALGRPATPEELSEYLALTRKTIEMAGNTEGLRQMLVAVLLESEFLYRLEFGAGEEDAHGRRMLSPREAAYAISYAMGDRGPDAKLLAAAAEGRLQTKEDYKREVERLLADEQYYRGAVDPAINGGHYQSNIVSHPRIVRFFREFFGYPGATKVFKDAPRAEGRYQNLDRGTLGTAGWLIREADLIVTWHVEKDQDVFKNLLTSDKYFVYDQQMGEQGEAIIAEWKRVWETLKDKPWQTEPMRVLEENFEFIKAQKSLRIDKLDQRNADGLVTHMRYFSEYFPKGKTPFPRVPWSHGYYINHSIFYSLPPTPMRGRYYPKPESPEYWAGVEYVDWWDFPLEQPFAIANRKGILSHPAWLVAHSTNFHTDPIRRGRWIQEKLLAGRVPDVPITVDAQVPDHPDMTFRERLEGVTNAPECWNCHQHMNPLGLPFEMYDDFGRNRTEELMEHPDNLIKRGNGKTTFDVYPTEPIDSSGELVGTGDSSLDGEVEEALDLIDKLAKSERVRQSIIRHAFRFYMGRNEMLSDAQTLRDADRAYVESGGSFRAVIVSLLTSDSFMYRK